MVEPQVEPLRPRYPTEFLLEFRSVDRFLFRVADLRVLNDHARAESLERLDHCHIYLLGKRPRLSAVPGTLCVTDNAVAMDVEYRVRDRIGRASFSVPRARFSPEEVSFAISAYPHRELLSRNAGGEVIVETILANFVHLMPEVPNEAKDLEVVYVGKGIRRSARDRLRHHKTLQEILADLGSNEPDQEVFALVYAFDFRKDAYWLTGTPEILGAPVKERRKRAMAYKPSLEERVALIEACCISYFRPTKYNTHYLDFPAGHYRVLDPVYAADFAQLVIQVDNTNIGNQRIYSASIEPAAVHLIVVDLRRLEGKFSLFAMLDADR
jgi:hypothetical protein